MLVSTLATAEEPSFVEHPLDYPLDRFELSHQKQHAALKSFWPEQDFYLGPRSMIQSFEATNELFTLITSVCQ